MYARIRTFTHACIVFIDWNLQSTVSVCETLSGSADRSVRNILFAPDTRSLFVHRGAVPAHPTTKTKELAHARPRSKLALHRFFVVEI